MLVNCGTGAIAALIAGCASAAPAWGQTTRLVPAVENSHPVVSPDGSLIAFSSNRDGTPAVYVMRADGGGVRRATNDAANEYIAGWSRDGRAVFVGVTERDTSIVRRVQLDGGGATIVGRFAGQGVRVTDDGRQAVFGVGPWGTMQVAIAGADGSAPRQLTSDGLAHWCSTASHRGDRIATARNERSGMQVWEVSVRDGAQRQITHFPREAGSPQCAAWSYDDRWIAVQSGAPAAADSTKRASHIWIVDVAGGSATKLGEHAIPYLDESPSWFPDGRVAFQSNRTGTWEVWVMDRDGEGVRQLTGARSVGSD